MTQIATANFQVPCRPVSLKATQFFFLLVVVHVKATSTTLRFTRTSAVANSQKCTQKKYKGKQAKNLLEETKVFLFCAETSLEALAEILSARKPTHE